MLQNHSGPCVCCYCGRNFNTMKVSITEDALVKLAKDECLSVASLRSAQLMIERLWKDSSSVPSDEVIELLGVIQIAIEKMEGK